MEYIIRHEFRDIHNALLKIFTEILKDKYEYTIYDLKEEKRKKVITDMSMRMVTEKEFGVTFHIKEKDKESTFKSTISCYLIMKEQGLGEFEIFSQSEDEAYTILNVFEFLTKRFYRAQLDRELLGE